MMNYLTAHLKKSSGKGWGRAGALLSLSAIIFLVCLVEFVLLADVFRQVPPGDA